ncbi:MAG: YbhB/YbcL family Raf kinase inhibitor-like protein [bacterium]|nr:YbhB/YbcL family Raf kinase inhibitor-like protein [bacterium]
MRWAYFLQGILFIGIIIIAVYAMELKGTANGTDIIDSKSGMTLSITSPDFENNGRFPSKNTCDQPNGRAISPPLVFSNVPKGAKSLALIMDDPDVPKALRSGVFDHWVLFNIDPSTTGIAEGGSAGTVGKNSAGQDAYANPCPPTQYEPKEHRYTFTLYALETILPLGEGSTKQEVLKAMEGKVIQQAQLIGRYSRL